MRLEQVEQQRRRDVVREIAHHAQLAPALYGQGGKVEAQSIGHMQRQALPRETLLQRSGQIAIDLDRIEATCALEQRFGQGAVSGTDLNKRILRRWTDRANDALDDSLVMQEVLTEAFAGEYHAAQPLDRRARVRARSTAARKLPTSALPVPARASAVP